MNIDLSEIYDTCSEMGERIKETGRVAKLNCAKVFAPSMSEVVKTVEKSEREEEGRMYTYRFAVKVEFDEQEPVIDSGVVIASTFGEAMTKLDTYYGAELIEVICLRPIGDTEVMLFPEEVLDKYEDEFIW